MASLQAVAATAAVPAVVAAAADAGDVSSIPEGVASPNPVLSDPLENGSDAGSSGTDTEMYAAEDDSFQLPRHHVKRLRGDKRRASTSSEDTVQSVVSMHTAASLTVLFRPAGKSESVSSLRLVQLEEFLASEAPNDLKEIRVNRPKNIIAVDVNTVGGVNKLLALQRLCAMPVRAFLPAAKCSIAGIIRVTDTSLSDDELSQLVRSSVPISSVKRLTKDGESVKILFSRAVLPAFVHLGSVKFFVSAYKARAIQCYKCGHFGHLRASCQKPQQCLRCAGGHDLRDCPSDSVARCINCGKDHSALDKRCAIHQQETAAHRYGLKEKVPLREARKIVRQKKPAPRSQEGSAATQPQKSIQDPANLQLPSKTVQRASPPAYSNRNTSAPGKAVTYCDVVKGLASSAVTSPPTASAKVDPVQSSSSEAPPKKPSNGHNPSMTSPDARSPTAGFSSAHAHSTFASFISLAFTVLKAVLECPWLPAGLHATLSILLPLEGSLLHFFGA